MAIWQFEFSLIPLAPLLSRFGKLPAELPEGITQDEDWWVAHQLPEGYAVVLDSFAPRCASWTTSILMWGQENGDRVHVGVEGGRVTWVTCRLDLRRFSREFTDGILRFADHCGCVLWVQPNRLVAPEQLALLEAIRVSDTMRFVTDPFGFLEGLSTVEQSG